MNPLYENYQIELVCCDQCFAISFINEELRYTRLINTNIIYKTSFLTLFRADLLVTAKITMLLNVRTRENYVEFPI